MGAERQKDSDAENLEGNSFERRTAFQPPQFEVFGCAVQHDGNSLIRSPLRQSIHDRINGGPVVSRRFGRPRHFGAHQSDVAGDIGREFSRIDAVL